MQRMVDYSKIFLFLQQDQLYSTARQAKYQQILHVSILEKQPL